MPAPLAPVRPRHRCQRNRALRNRGAPGNVITELDWRTLFWGGGERLRKRRCASVAGASATAAPVPAQ